MKRLPNVIISPRQLDNELFEYKVCVGENNLVLYVYSAEEEEEEVIKDWTITWWDSISKQNSKRILN